MERLSVSGDKIVAVGLLTQNDLELLGDTFSRVWPVHEASCFKELLQAIDEAGRRVKKTNQPSQD